ncbi:MAG: hypothetical protein RXR06_12005 [Thermoproteus sp.]|jgi:hypothetical protein
MAWGISGQALIIAAVFYTLFALQMFDPPYTMLFLASQHAGGAPIEAVVRCEHPPVAPSLLPCG